LLGHEPNPSFTFFWDVPFLRATERTMAEYFLRIALWQVGTMVSNSGNAPANAVSGLNHDERCRILEERLSAASSILSGYEAPAGAKVVSVFAAPEYLFAASDTTHFVDVATKDRVIEKLKQMTRRFPNILLFPGTIAWKKRMKEDGRFGKDRSKAAYRRLDIMTQKHPTGSGNYQQHRDRLDQAEMRTTWFAQNTAYVMKDGKIVLKYHKMADGGEVFREDREDGMVVWVPGERKGKVQVEGLDFGLEICAERGAGMLEKWEISNLDVHVLISASHPANPGNTGTRNGGYLLHADAHHPPAAYRKNGGASTVVRARHSFPSLGGTVNYYGLPLTK
jgi:hypothetical protein